MGKKFKTSLHVGSPGLDEAGLRSAALADPVGFIQKAEKMIEDGDLSWGKIQNLERLFNSLYDVPVEAHVTMHGRTRAVETSAFPILSGMMTVSGVNAAYDAVPTIGEELVTDMNDNKKVTNLANITSFNPTVDGVKEGDDFPEIGASEERYEIRHKRNGRRLSITAETIEENDVAGIVAKIDALGEIAGETVEEQTLSRVCDEFGSATSPAEPYVLHSPAAASLYSTTANTPGERTPAGTRINSNALVDTTDLDTARLILAAHTNSRGTRIAMPVSQMQLLVPTALEGTAAKILGSALEPSVENEENNWGPNGRWRPMLVSSPKLDDISTSAWYLGNFKKQFVRKWKLNFEYVTLGTDTESYLTSRIAFQARIGWDVEVGARDYVHVVQCLSGTTAP